MKDATAPVLSTKPAATRGSRKSHRQNPPTSSMLFATTKDYPARVRHHSHTRDCRMCSTENGISDRAVFVKEKIRCGCWCCRRGSLNAGALHRRRGQRGAPAAKRGRTTLRPATRAAQTQLSDPGRVTVWRSPSQQSGWAGRFPTARHLFAPRWAHGGLQPQLERAQSLSRPRHQGGGHAVPRARARAVTIGSQLASARARQRSSPSRRP
jgi:hypothetical protein